jgi:hypothetical protein
LCFVIYGQLLSAKGLHDKKTGGHRGMGRGVGVHVMPLVSHIKSTLSRLKGSREKVDVWSFLQLFAKKIDKNVIISYHYYDDFYEHKKSFESIPAK